MANISENRSVGPEDLAACINTDLKKDIIRVLLKNPYGLHTLEIQRSLKLDNSVSLSRNLVILKNSGLLVANEVYIAVTRSNRVSKGIMLSEDATLIQEGGRQAPLKKGYCNLSLKKGEIIVNRNGFSIPVKDQPRGTPKVVVYKIKSEIYPALSEYLGQFFLRQISKIP